MSPNRATILHEATRTYPREIEDVLCTHPAIAEVAVVGIPDARPGPEVTAFAALRPGRTATEAEIVAYVKERVASCTYPRSVEFRDHLPVSATGTVMKREL